MTVPMTVPGQPFTPVDWMRLHYTLQRGRFISSICESGPGCIVSSQVSVVPLWNHAAWLSDHDESLNEFVRHVEDSWPNARQRPVLYLPESIDWNLPEYERFDREAWLVLDLTNPLGETPKSLRVEPVISVETMESFVSVFERAFQVTDPRYAEEFRREQCAAGTVSECQRHFIGYDGKQAVCVATLVRAGNLAGLYNVGCVPEARGRGCASELMRAVIAEAAAAGITQLFLQVEAGSTADRLYRRLGFREEFCRVGLRRRDWVLPGDGEPLLRPARSDQRDERSPAILIGQEPPPYKPVCEAVAEWARSAPGKQAAVVTGIVDKPGQSLSYGELEAGAREWALVLRERGVTAETCVGLGFDRSLEMLVALLAAWQAGGAVVPLDLSQPPERLAQMLKETEAPIVLTRSHLRSKLQATRAEILCLDETPPAVRRDVDLPEVARAGDLAYVLFTSGSTGRPKGVLLEHGALSQHAQDCMRHYALTASDRVLQFSPLGFDAAFEQILAAWFAGATLILRDEEVWKPRELAAHIERERITVLDLPTAYWHQTALEWSQTAPGSALDSVRLVIVGGEAMSSESVRLWRATPCSGARLLNAYGPTEATITASTHEVTERDALPEASGVVPIGEPRAGRVLWLRNDDGSPAEAGEAGELCIAGPLLARGYLNQPELTAARFLAGGPNGERFYGTGDRARVRRDGTLEFLGRIDDQVKVRGFRVEPQEIETHLLSHPALKLAAVVLHGSSTAERKLVGFYTLKPEYPAPTNKELRRHLARHAPDYAIPGLWIPLDQLPLLSSGKVDRRRLAAWPLATAREHSRSMRAPRDPLELRLKHLFERVLRQRPVGTDVSFFELGGDSLQALELLVQIERMTGRNLPLGTLYQTATVQGLAAFLKETAALAPSDSLVPLQTSGSRPPLFLVHTTPGDVLGYGNFVFHLSSDQPCYGLQSRGLFDVEHRHRHVEEMAAHYVRQVRELQAHGPYFLGGWCYGGIVAVEMARLLLKAGEEVAFLGLLETVAPMPSGGTLSYYTSRAFGLMRLPPRRWFQYLQAKLRYRREMKEASQMRFRRVGITEVRSAEEQERQNRRLAQLEQVYHTNLEALNHYRLEPYPGRVTLFNAEQIDPGIITDEWYGWRGLAQSIEVHVVPGDHRTMLAEPHVAVLAHRFETSLRAAHEACPREPLFSAA